MGELEECAIKRGDCGFCGDCHSVLDNGNLDYENLCYLTRIWTCKGLWGRKGSESSDDDDSGAKVGEGRIGVIHSSN